MALNATVDVLEGWLIHTGHLSSRVNLQDFEVYMESEYMRIFLCVRRDRNSLVNPDGPVFNLTIPFDEDNLYSLLQYALDTKR